METDNGFYLYVLGRLPLILTFASGYIVYLLLAATKMTDGFVWWSVQRSGGSVKALLAHVIGAAAVLSFFIPNAVTVLTLLPIIKAIEEDIASQNGDYSLTTALTLAVIYGANIGGMGSLIGSPANLLLIGALDLYGVAGKEQISFLNWFLWSIPLVLMFVAVAWALVVTFGVPGALRQVRLRFKDMNGPLSLSLKQKRGCSLFLFFLFFWITEGILKEFYPPFASYEPYVCIAFFLLFSYHAFARPLGPEGSPLLHLGHLAKGLPKRGILFLGVVLLIIPTIRFLEVDKQIAQWFSQLIRPDTGAFLVFFGTTLGVIFLTEVLSNTVIATAFFPIVYFAAETYQMAPLMMMIAVSIASTCAFMTPIATPCNALAFGEMRKTSLRKMLSIGFPLNIIGAFLITVWLQFVIPVIYQ